MKRTADALSVKCAAFLFSSATDKRQKKPRCRRQCRSEDHLGEQVCLPTEGRADRDPTENTEFHPHRGNLTESTGAAD